MKDRRQGDGGIICEMQEDQVNEDDLSSDYIDPLLQNFSQQILLLQYL